MCSRFFVGIARSLGVFVLAGVAAGCGSDDPAGPAESTLVINVSSSRTATAPQVSWWRAIVDQFAPQTLYAAMQTTAGSPTAMRMRFFSVHIGASPDCTGLTEVGRFPGGMVANLVEEPTLIEADVDDGTYRCLVIEVEDQLAIFPDAVAAAAFPGRCTAGAESVTDLYRAGDEVVYRDLGGAAIPGRGSRASPVADRIFVFASTTPSAASSRTNGPTADQTVLLSGALTVPGQTTLYIDATDGLLGDIDDGTPYCVVEGGQLGFR